jgi:hypothetical protein
MRAASRTTSTLGASTATSQFAASPPTTSVRSPAVSSWAGSGDPRHHLGEPPYSRRQPTDIGSRHCPEVPPFGANRPTCRMGWK